MQTTESLVGMTMAGYLLTAQLSSNSYSQTYLGETTSDTGQKHTVALKHFHTRPLTSRDNQQQFLREAQLFKELKHPSILPIVAYGIEEKTSTPYIINDFAPFRSLHNRILRQWPQPFALAEARTIITRIGEALAYAHERKIVHGNLTAHSVLFNANNEALLTDFTIISLRANVSPEMPTDQAPDINSEQGDLRALVSMFATLLSSGKSSAASSNGRPISSPGNWLPQTRITLPASVPLPIQAAINRVLDAEAQPGFASVKDFLAAIQMPMSTNEDAKTESPQSTAPGKITGILPDVSAEVSRSVSQGLQEGMETQRPAFPSRPTTSTTTPLSRTKTPDPSARMTRPLSSDRPLASNRQISRMLESQPPLQAKKAFPGAASTRTPVTPLPIPPLEANSEPEANHAQATEKPQSPDAQTAKLAPPAQLEPKGTPSRAGNRRSVFVLGTSVVVLACICVVTLIYAFQRPGTSTHIPLQALATASQQQTDTSTTPGFSPTSQATSSSGSRGVQKTPQTHVTPKPGQTPSTQANNTPTTGQPATNPTTVAPTQAPAPKAFYSFEGSTEGWSGEFCDVQVSSQYVYAGANSLEAKNIASYSYAHIYGATISQGETITFYVYVPAGSSSVSVAVSIGNDANNWDDGPKVTLIPGQWNSVSHTLAKNIPGPLKIGLDMYASGTASVYIDAVSWG